MNSANSILPTFDKVADSIGAFGFCAPILIGKDNLVLDVAAHLEAARSLGLERVPSVRVEHLSENEQRVLRLAVTASAKRMSGASRRSRSSSRN